VAGWSGGGPHALAIAAMVPGCTEALLLSGFGPATVPDLDFLTGMNDAVIEEFTLAFEGEEEFEAALIDAAVELQTVTREGLLEALGGDLCEQDQLALQGPLGDFLVKSFQHAVMKTSAGWRDDDSALVRNWGFSLDHVRVPVTVASGGADTRVPPSHGAWLANHLPQASAKVFEGAGHLSILEHLGELLSEMTDVR
ncbi:MAG: alpha/beta hydrolase, partial [Actinomycetota bacterium]